MFFAAVYPFPTNKIAHWYQKINVFSYSRYRIRQSWKITSYLQVLDSIYSINQPTRIRTWELKKQILKEADPMDTSRSGNMKKIK